MLLPHFAIILQIGKRKLTQGFENGDGHGVAQIQTADAFPHGDAYAAFPVVFQEAFRQSFGLLAEEQVTTSVRASTPTS